MEIVESHLSSAEDLIDGMNTSYLNKTKIPTEEFALKAEDVIKLLFQAEDQGRASKCWGKKPAPYSSQVNTKAWDHWLFLLRVAIRNYAPDGYEYSQTWNRMIFMKKDNGLKFCRIVNNKLVWKDDLRILEIFLRWIQTTEKYSALHQVFSLMLVEHLEVVEVPDLYLLRQQIRDTFPALKKFKDQEPRHNCAATHEYRHLRKIVGGGAETL